MRKTFWFWLCFVVSILLATYFATRVIMIKMGYGTPATVHHISVVAHAPDIDMTSLQTAAQINPGTKAYSVDLDSINARVGAVPGVKESAVRRLPNGNISIHAKMHNTVGQWTDGKNFYPISDAGVIIEKPSETRARGAVVFRGTVPNNITKITNATRDIADIINYLEWIEDRRWNIYTQNGIKILLPEDSASTPEYEPAAAIAQIISLNQNHDLLSRKIKMIDLRDNKRMLIR